MTALPRGRWDRNKATPHEFHILAFDPGGVMGWAHLVLDRRAFSRPEHSALAYLRAWNTGEFEGTEDEILTAATNRIWLTRFPPGCLQHMDVLGEDFELIQLIGGKNLLSPVRQNAVLDWECRKTGMPYHLQQRQARKVQTAERLRLFGFNGKWTTTGKGKDAFAAMQHAVTWLRRIKAESRIKPWMIPGPQGIGQRWDCDCAEGYRCNLKHPT